MKSNQKLGQPLPAKNNKKSQAVAIRLSKKFYTKTSIIAPTIIIVLFTASVIYTAIRFSKPTSFSFSKAQQPSTENLESYDQEDQNYQPPTTSLPSSTPTSIPTTNPDSTSTPTPNKSSDSTPTPISSPGSSATPTPTSTASATAADANQDNVVDELDYDIWLGHYLQSTVNGSQDGDFNLDKSVDGLDYAIWRYLVTI